MENSPLLYIDNDVSNIIGIYIKTYKTLISLSKVLLPDAKLSISKTIEQIANEKAKKLNGKIKSK